MIFFFFHIFSTFAYLFNHENVFSTIILFLYIFIPPFFIDDLTPFFFLFGIIGSYFSFLISSLIFSLLYPLSAGKKYFFFFVLVIFLLFSNLSNALSNNLQSWLPSDTSSIIGTPFVYTIAVIFLPCFIINVSSYLFCSILVFYKSTIYW